MTVSNHILGLLFAILLISYCPTLVKATTLSTTEAMYGGKKKIETKKKEPRYRGFQNNTGSMYKYSRKNDMLVKRTIIGRVLFRLVHPFNRYPHRMV